MKQVIGYISVCNTFGLEVRDIVDDCVFANWSFDPNTEYTCPIMWDEYRTSPCTTTCFTCPT